MSKKTLIPLIFIALIAFMIPIEHKYDKLFRFFSLKLIPEGLELSKGYEKKLYFYLSDIFSLILLGIGLLWIRIPVRRFFGNPLWIVFVCALFSIIASPYFGYPVAYSRLLQLLTPIILFSFISSGAVDPQKLTKYVIMAIVCAGLFQAVVGISQYFVQDTIGLRLLGETNQKTTFTVFQGGKWLIDELMGNIGEKLLLMRAAGTLPHANVFGGFLFFSTIGTYALYIQSKSRLWALTIPIQFFALSLSFSRSALFAWALATLCWFVQMGILRGFKEKKLQFLGVIIAFSLSLSAILLANQYRDRGGVVSTNNLSKSSDNIRKVHQVTAVNIIKDHPILGLGFSQFSERTRKYFKADENPYVVTTAPHNIFLILATETGLISLFAFIYFIFTLVRSYFRTAITPESALFSSLLLGFLFIGFCDFYPILFQQGKLMFFLIAALLVANTKVCNSYVNVVKKIPV